MNRKESDNMNPVVVIDMSNPEDIMLSCENVLLYEKQGYIAVKVKKIGDGDRYMIYFERQ